MARLTAAAARRIALAAQGLPRRPPAKVDAGRVRRVVERLGLVQIDSVNVVARAHYLPLYARLGPYPTELLDRVAYRDRRLFEYWGHEASLIPVAQQPLLRWRMAAAKAGATWHGLARFGRERPEFVRAVLDEVTERGPLRAAELAEPGDKRGPWWGWADGKRALELLFWQGDVAVAGRRNFERVYDVPERVLPAEVIDAPTPPEREARRALVLVAARALGIATARVGNLTRPGVRLRSMTKRIVGIGLAVLVVLGAAVAALDGDGGGGEGDRDTAAGGRETAVVDGATLEAGPDEARAQVPSGVPAAGDSFATAGGVAAADGGAAGSAAGGGAVGATGVAPAAPVGGPKIVKRAELRIEVRRHALRAAFDRVASIAGGLGGFVASSSTAEEEETASGTLTLRIPADRFDEARKQLAAIGEVKGEQLSGEEVTGQLVDFDARLRSLQAQEEALRTLLGRARAVGEVLEVQGQLFNVRQQIEQLQAQRAQLADAAELATITAHVSEPGAPLLRSTPAEGEDNAFERAWQGTVDVAGGMVIVVGYALPFALLALLVWLIAKVAGVRRRGAPSPAA